MTPILSAGLHDIFVKTPESRVESFAQRELLNNRRRDMTILDYFTAQPFQVMSCSILGRVIPKPDNLLCFVSCGPASKTCGLSLLALPFKWHPNCQKHGGTQQEVAGTWQMGPRLKLSHAIYFLGVPQLCGTLRKGHAY
jgi:hypothetical protein